MNTPSLVFLFFFFFFFSVALSSSPAHSKYFTFELIHRDSPLSPIYNPQNTATERLKAAFLRSISRSRRFNQKTDLQSGLIIGADPGDYLMSITIGTPPQKFHALVDTGSDLIWVQCKPCQNCAKAIDLPFNNKNSSTYKSEPCDSPHCNLLNEQKSCDTNGNLCQYNYKYGDGSFSTGHIATETISINSASGSPVSFPGTIIGCGYTKHGHFDETGSGIIGLGDGPLSLISQLSSSMFVPVLARQAVRNKFCWGADLTNGCSSRSSSDLRLNPRLGCLRIRCAESSRFVVLMLNMQPCV